MVSKPFKFPAPAFRRAEVAVSWKDQLDPFILYLEKLREWDGTPRIDDLLTHFFESESPAELSAWAIWGVVPVRVDGPLTLPDRIRTELPEMRDQMWAEGLVRYRKGENVTLPNSIQENPGKRLRATRVQG